MATTTAQSAPRTLAVLADLLWARRASAAQCAEVLRRDVADALSLQDLGDLFDREEPSVDVDATTALMLVDRAERRLWEVEEALARVADSTYGYCIGCGAGIPLVRLRALPATASCIECSRHSPDPVRELVNGDHQKSNKIQGTGQWPALAYHFPGGPR